MTKDRKVFSSTGSSSGHGRKRKNSTPNLSLEKLKLRHHTRPGDIGYLIYLHGVVYSKKYGYDQTFEAYVADGLAKFIRTFNPDKDRIWLAERNDQIVGSIAIVGHSKLGVQLRWLFVHPKYRGLGMGRRLLNQALHFCKEQKDRAVFLWTTSELNTAQRLYTNAGFRRTRRISHQIWGRKITEERYDLDL